MSQPLRFFVFIAAWGLAAPGLAQSTHPREYTRIHEETSDSRVVNITNTGLKAEIDRTSDVIIEFDAARARATTLALDDGDKIELRVEAAITRAGATQSAPLAIDNYYMLVRDKAGTVTSIDISEQALINNGGTVTGFLPTATLDLTSQALSPGDVVRVRVTNLSTQESIDKILTTRDFGLPGEIKDSLFFLDRLRVSAENPVAGADNVHFGPAPGVSYLWTVSARSNQAARFLRPSFGVNVSFTDWDDDPTFNQSTGQFAAGTSGTDIEIGFGLVAAVLDGVVQVTAGRNLNVETRPFYFGLGFSFVNLVDRLGKVIPKK
jgi:hypothetical protein